MLRSLAFIVGLSLLTACAASSNASAPNAPQPLATQASTPTPAPSMTPGSVFVTDALPDGLAVANLDFTAILFDGANVTAYLRAFDDAGPGGCSLLDWVDRSGSGQTPGILIAQLRNFSPGQIMLYGALAPASGTHLHDVYAYCRWANALPSAVVTWRHLITVTQ